MPVAQGGLAAWRQDFHECAELGQPPGIGQRDKPLDLDLNPTVHQPEFAEQGAQVA